MKFGIFIKASFSEETSRSALDDHLARSGATPAYASANVPPSRSRERAEGRSGL
jgi:hypothetical protein